MSEHKVQGGTMLLFIDPMGGTNYDTVVCLTSVSQTDSVQPVDASSACGPDKSPGAVDMSISFEGQHLQDPATGSISGTNLLQLLRAEQTIGWKLSPVSPVAGDEIQEGTGYLSELSSTYNYSEIGVFSGTIQPYGVPTSNVQSSRFSFDIFTNIIDSFNNDFQILSNNNYNINVYWGDGSFDNYNSNTINLYHNYSSLSNYTVEIEFISYGDPAYIYMNNNEYKNIKNINYLFEFNINNGLLINGCNITSDQVNDILHQALSGNLNNNTSLIDLTGNIPLAPPTGQGLIDKATLEANGCTVIVDSALAIGQSYQGGNIAYLDGSGEHGFIVWNSGGEYIFDQWSIAYGSTGAVNTAIGGATANTQNIVLNTASVVASNIYLVPINGYTDWVWPTKDEIRTIINNAGSFPTPLDPGIFIYQSSSEIDANNFWGVAVNGSDYPSDKLTLYSTMIIRYF